MERLYLLRHGLAVPHGTPGVAEDERPLTAEGERRVAEIASGLKRLGVDPERVVTSPLPRARRTAEIVAATLGLGDGLENADPLRPGTPAGESRDWLKSRGESRLMLVGHDPGLTDVLGLLLGWTAVPPPFVLKKGGVAALRADGRGGYLLDWLATPRLFRRLSD